MSNNHIELTSNRKFAFKSYLREFLGPDSTLLKLEKDGKLTVTGKESFGENRSVEFYIDRTTNDRVDLIYRFRPVTQPDKYIAVSGRNIVLKSLNQVSDNSHSFKVVEQNKDYAKFQSVSSSPESPMYITADKSGAVFMAEDDPRDLRRAWFKICQLFKTTSEKEVNVTEMVDLLLEVTTITVTEE